MRASKHKSKIIQLRGFLVLLAILAGLSLSACKTHSVSTEKDEVTQRPQHYYFAHTYLRNSFFNDGYSLLTYLESNPQSITKIWNEFGKNFIPENREEKSTLEYKLKLYQNSFAIAFVRLPETIQKYEVSLIAMVVNEKGLRYITLERTDSQIDTDLWLGNIAEWNKQGEHRVIRSTPMVGIANFETIVLDVLNQEKLKDPS